MKTFQIILHTKEKISIKAESCKVTTSGITGELLNISFTGLNADIPLFINFNQVDAILEKGGN